MARVTVLMPTYNVAPWVEESIHSVLNQTYRDFELLVVDDASTDDTLDRVRAIDDPRIRIAAFPNNVGLAENLNRGLGIIDTELVARMDGDDIAEPDWLETGINVLDTHPEVGICSFGFQFFGTKTSLVRFPEHHEDSKAQMLFGCTVIVPVFRKSVFSDNQLRYNTEAFPAQRPTSPLPLPYPPHPDFHLASGGSDCEVQRSASQDAGMAQSQLHRRRKTILPRQLRSLQNQF